MKRVLIVIAAIILMIPYIVSASTKELNIYLFYGNGCPHCKAENKFLESYIKKNDYIKLHKYEIWYDEDNAEKYEQVHKILKDESSGIPFLVIGNNTITGYSEGYSEEKIINTINYYKNRDYKDLVGEYLGVVKASNEKNNDKEKYSTNEVDLPLIGKKDAKSISLFFSTILLGLVDGFNPCAMWILIFLISMLIGMKNKKRMWTLGITFLFSSATVYFLFLISWLNLAVFLNKIVYLRIGISLVAIIFGTYSILKFVDGVFKKKDDGCEVVDSKNRKRIMTAIRKIVKEKSFILAILGIILLSASVNVIELLCSLGLPVVFTQLLAINDIPSATRILYALLYVFFFLIDDIVVFVIAMKTLEIKAISNKFGKYSHLIGGILMFLIGALMILKPEWLMFNF